MEITCNFLSFSYILCTKDLLRFAVYEFLLFSSSFEFSNLPRTAPTARLAKTFI